jgi:hypothetical protein
MVRFLVIDDFFGAAPFNLLPRPSIGAPLSLSIHLVISCLTH